MFSSTIEATIVSSGPFDAGGKNAVWADSWNEYRESEIREEETNRRMCVVRPSFRVLMQEMNVASKSEAYHFVERACETKRYICEKKGYRLEPFQNEIFRAIIASRLDRVFGSDASRHRLRALETLGVVSNDDTTRYRSDPTGNIARKLSRLCEEFSRKYIVVKAPRRTGKNLVSQIAVVVLLLHEPNVTVVNWAQSMACAMLNCEEILKLLDICKSKYPALNYRSTKEGVVVWPRRGLRSTLRVKPNTANVSIARRRCCPCPFSSLL
jgi:hypothetical protein